MTKRPATSQSDLQNAYLPLNKVLVQENMACSAYQADTYTADPLCLVMREQPGGHSQHINIKQEKDALEPDPLCLVKREESEDEQGSYGAEGPILEPLVVIKEEQEEVDEDAPPAPTYGQPQGVRVGAHHYHHNLHNHNQQPDAVMYAPCACACQRTEEAQKDSLSPLLRSSSVSLFKKPLRVPPTQVLYRCGGCGRVFSHLDGYRTHLHTRIPGAPLCCFWCGAGFPHRRALSEHQLEAPTGPPGQPARYACSLCRDSFTTLCKLRKHELCEVGRKMAVGDRWGFHPACAPAELAVYLVYFESASILERVCTHHGDEPFSCWRCGKSYGLAKNLQKHEDLHRAERPFECTRCPALFPTRGQWLRHAWVHIGKFPATCLVCGDAFDASAKLVEHGKDHEVAGGPDVCACGLVCGDRTKLAQHQRVCFHANDTCYVCVECNSAFGRKGLLLRHARQHKTDRPYTCDECGMPQANTNDACTHANERACDHCGFVAEHFGQHMEHVMTCGRDGAGRANGQSTTASTDPPYLLTS